MIFSPLPTFIFIRLYISLFHSLHSSFFILYSTYSSMRWRNLYSISNQHKKNSFFLHLIIKYIVTTWLLVMFSCLFVLFIFIFLMFLDLSYVWCGLNSDWSISFCFYNIFIWVLSREIVVRGWVYFYFIGILTSFEQINNLIPLSLYIFLPRTHSSF